MKSYYQMTKEEKLQSINELPLTEKELKHLQKKRKMKDAKKLKTKK